MAEPIRVLLADDHPVFLDGLALLLGSSPEVEVVAKAADGEEALALIEELDPDVAVLDLQMPGLNGIEVTRALRERGSRTEVLVLTMFDHDASVVAALRAGARGYVLKGAGHDDVLRAITSVSRGDAVLTGSLADRVVQRFGAEGAAPVFPELTDREREILGLIAQGLNNETIARRFALSPKTVRNHVSNIFSKLHVQDRAQAIVKAREAGLGTES